jgi:hypothetical protein
MFTGEPVLHALTFVSISCAVAVVLITVPILPSQRSQRKLIMTGHADTELSKVQVQAAQQVVMRQLYHAITVYCGPELGTGFLPFRTYLDLYMPSCLDALRSKKSKSTGCIYLGTTSLKQLQILSPPATPDMWKLGSLTRRTVGIVKCSFPADVATTACSTYTPWPIFVFENRDQPDVIKALGRDKLDSPKQYGHRNTIASSAVALLRSRIYIPVALKGPGFCVARSLTAAMLLQIGWSEAVASRFLQFAMAKLGFNATYKALGEFLRTKEFKLVVNEMTPTCSRGTIANVELGGKTKHWTEKYNKDAVHSQLYPPIGARTIQPRHIRRAEKDIYPQLLLPVDRRGCDNHMYMLAPTRLGGKLVIWDPSNVIDSEPCVPWFTNWNCIQFDIVSVKQSFPLRVVFKARAHKRRAPRARHACRTKRHKHNHTHANH